MKVLTYNDAYMYMCIINIQYIFDQDLPFSALYKHDMFSVSVNKLLFETHVYRNNQYIVIVIKHANIWLLGRYFKQKSAFLLSVSIL